MNLAPSDRRPPGAFPWILAGGAAVALLAAAIGWHLGSGPGAPAGRKGEVGDPAPAFQRESLDGRRLGPASFPSRVVLVDFWATWCGPCHIQAEVLRPLYEEFHGRGVEFLAVSLAEDGKTVHDFIAEHPVAYPVLIDPDDSLAAEFQIYALPTLMVIDRLGKVAFRSEGFTDGETLREILKRAGAA